MVIADVVVSFYNVLNMARNDRYLLDGWGSLWDTHGSADHSKFTDETGNPELASQGLSDHNRVWTQTGFSTVDTLTAAMNSDTGGQVDYFLDFHSDSGSAVNYF